MEVTLKDLGGEAELQIVAGRHLGFGFLIFFQVGRNFSMFIEEKEPVKEGSLRRHGVSIGGSHFLKSWETMRIHRALVGISFWTKEAVWVVWTNI